MSTHIGHRLCYADCNNCNAVLAVSVPCSSPLKILRVRCGHCMQLLLVKMGSSLHPLPALQPEQNGKFSYEYRKDLASSSTSREKPTNTTNEESSILSNKTPEKRSPRVPSAYNSFIKEEIQRIKASKPGIRHREAFSAASKNWANVPDVSLGLMAMNNNIISAENIHKVHWQQQHTQEWLQNGSSIVIDNTSLQNDVLSPTIVEETPWDNNQELDSSFCKISKKFKLI